MYESSQVLVQGLLVFSVIVCVGGFIASLINIEPRHPENHTNGVAKGTRIGNHRDQSRIAIETRARLATGRTADGSADYCHSSARRNAPITKPATAEKIGPAC